MKKLLKKLFFPVTGIAALIWFLIRVIPKPSRASYPCVQAAAPIASSFVLYLLGLASSVMFFKKAKNYLYQARYAMFLVAVVAGIFLSFTAYLFNNQHAFASHKGIVEASNQPIGTGVGIFPGRVAWIHNKAATNEFCANEFDDFWWQDANTDQNVVNQMVSDAIQDISGRTTDAEAWDAIFKFYNSTHNRGDVGYTAGEKIVIKINLNGGLQFQNINTSPQITYSILNQLVNVAGVAQSDISVGDPGKSFEMEFWDKCHPVFPDINYWGKNADIVASDEKVFFSSDGQVSDYLPASYVEATYMINIPVFKKHHRGGISITSKNHFGSFVPFNGSAFHLHYSLPCPDGMADVSNGDYGAYRIFVDFIGHQDLGGKTILYLVDGLWSSINWGHPALKWSMAPFNNDWPNSIFASLDPVAIESVCFDFLRTEYDENHPEEGDYDPRDDHGPFPQYAGVDDFLHQAASSTNWPAGITYDPEDDGTPLPASMGAHEHWNNAAEKKYSRNLGGSTGIELSYNRIVSIPENSPLKGSGVLNLSQNSPNPFSTSTKINYTLSAAASIKVLVYDGLGKIVKIINVGSQNLGEYTIDWNGTDTNGQDLSAGTYIVNVEATSNNQVYNQNIKAIKN